MNSSCNDSEISSGGELSASRCTSSCGERSSVSELDLSCSASDTEDLTKSTSATDNEAKTEQSPPKEATADERKAAANDGNNNSEPPAPSQAPLVKTESKRRSILLSNQVTKSKSSSSISTAAPKLLLPRDALDGYECCPKSTEKMVKFFTYFLREDVEYKTLSISNNTTSRQVIAILLDKVSLAFVSVRTPANDHFSSITDHPVSPPQFKMKHRDANLFYLTMEIIIRKNGIPVRSAIVLNDEACPAQLKACYPNEEIRFVVLSKPGSLVRVFDSCLMAGSLYKSIIIDYRTTVSELVQLTLNCYHSKDKASNYSLFVVSKTGSYQLAGHELPLEVQEEWNPKNDPIFQLRKIKEVNYNYLNKTVSFWKIRPSGGSRFTSSARANSVFSPQTVLQKEIQYNRLQRHLAAGLPEPLLHMNCHIRKSFLICKSHRNLSKRGALVTNHHRHRCKMICN